MGSPQVIGGVFGVILVDFLGDERGGGLPGGGEESGVSVVEEKTRLHQKKSAKDVT